jgi:hypothetical protein
MGRQRLRKCPSRRPCRSTERSAGRRSRITLVQRRGAKSLADDLITGQGVVFGRATSTLRSVETYPLIGRFVFRPDRSDVKRGLASPIGGGVNRGVEKASRTDRRTSPDVADSSPYLVGAVKRASVRRDALDSGALF